MAIINLRVSAFPSSPTNSYLVEVNFMHGDGDYYTNLTYDMQNDMKEISDCVEFFERCKVEASQGMSGMDNYKHVEGYWHEGESNKRCDDGYNLYEGRWDIPEESPYCSDVEASVKEVKLYWYDAQGAKFEVTYDKTI
jgi:hypothetical protein